MERGCKIYTKVTFDMSTGETLEEEFFKYAGALELCAPEGFEGGEGAEGAEGDSAEGFEEVGLEGEEGIEEGDYEEEDSEEFTPAELKAQLRDLQAKLVELESLQSSAASKSPDSQPIFQDMPIVQDSDALDDILSSPDNFNSVMNTTLQGFGEQLMKAIPGIVQNAVVQQNSMQEMAKQFYTENSDLGGYKKFVSQVSEKLSSEHPDWGVEKLMDETAKEARMRLNLRKKTQKKNTSKNPGLPKRQSGGTRGRRNTPNPKQSQIDEMNKALGGI